LVQECKFYVLGFVPVDVVRLKKDVWFRKLDTELAELVHQYLAELDVFDEKKPWWAHILGEG